MEGTEGSRAAGLRRGSPAEAGCRAADAVGRAAGAAQQRADQGSSRSPPHFDLYVMLITRFFKKCDGLVIKTKFISIFQ